MKLLVLGLFWEILGQMNMKNHYSGCFFIFVMYLYLMFYLSCSYPKKICFTICYVLVLNVLLVMLLSKENLFYLSYIV